MDMQAERMPYLDSVEDRQDMITWWAGVGEAGFDRLLELAQDPREKVADQAYAALAASRDQRLVPFLRAIPWDADAPAPLQYSRARTHLRLGDWSHVDVLIDGLRDDNVFVRGNCLRTLKSATNYDFGYHPNSPEEEREAAVQRWEQWYRESAPEAAQK
ncbi:MAG: hypothetical protein R3F33_11305 [Planctomycetota bacterium]